MLRHGETPKGINVNVPSLAERRGVGFKNTTTANLTLRSEVDVRLFARWLYDKLRDSPTTRLAINGVNVRIVEDEIARVIQEEMAKEEDRP